MGARADEEYSNRVLLLLARIRLAELQRLDLDQRHAVRCCYQYGRYPVFALFARVSTPFCSRRTGARSFRPLPNPSVIRCSARSSNSGSTSSEITSCDWIRRRRPNAPDSDRHGPDRRRSAPRQGWRVSSAHAALRVSAVARRWQISILSGPSNVA